MKDKNNKNVFMWILLVVLVIIIVLVLNKNASYVAQVEQPVATDTTTPPVDETEDVTAGSVHVGAPAATLSYQAALVKYAKARIQLDSQCSAVPNNVTYKNGTDIMIDNRAPITRNIHLGTYFDIKAYGFKIVHLSSSTLPAKLLLDCGNNQKDDQNVATILIQK